MKKMKFLVSQLYMLALLALPFISSSCSDDDDDPKVEITSLGIEDGATVNAGQAVELKAQINNNHGTTSYSWVINGKEVSTENIYTFQSDTVKTYTIQLTVNNEYNTVKKEINITVAYPASFYVINEGKEYSSINQYKEGKWNKKIIEDLGYDNLVVSIKSSDVMMCVKAHELIAKQTNHPLHVGITESGTIFSGSIKSSIGLGLILNQGIGDTIRVSLTDDPVREIEAAKLILKTLGLRKGGIEVVSCPTCGRTRINLIDLAGKVEKMVSGYDLDLKLAVMGCVVNGPGEAKEADLGIAGGDGCGVLIKHGEIIKKVPEEELLDTLRYELDNWNE